MIESDPSSIRDVSKGAFMLFLPFALLFMVLFLLAILFFFFFVQINLIALAFVKIGIPVKKIPQETMVTERRMTFFGFRYVVPAWKQQVTIVAVNVGGAIIPTLISIYLLLKTGLYFRGMIATFLMIIVCNRLARPVRGVGIALPFFIPPLLAAVVSLILAYDHAPMIAYISGTLGTLIGADLLNLKKIRNLGAPVASIGGAGTFDGIFLTGILAVLLSAILV
jgi:uncharacterized membrane protein